jgi:outer membrane protein X
MRKYVYFKMIKTMKNNVFKAVIIVVALVMVGNVYCQEKGDKAIGANMGIATAEGTSNFGPGLKFQYNVTKPLRAEGAFTYYMGDFSFWDVSVNGHYLIGIPNTPKLNVYPLAGLSLSGYGGDSGDADSDAYYIDPATGEKTFVSYDDEDEYEDEDDATSDSSTRFGFNLGGGADYKLTDKVHINAELKYRFGFNDFNRFVISVGIAYKF